MKKRTASVAVIGLGQIGGSLALALRKAMPSSQILGIDISRKRINLMRNVLSYASTKIEDAEPADLIFVCLHFREIMKYLKTAPREPLIVDVCSGKRKVVALANHMKLRFIGGHPLAGNERPAEKGWDAALFRNAPFFLCPSKNATRRDLAQVTGVVRKIHARPIIVNPAVHDRAMALTSHLPALLSQMYRKFTQSVPREFQGPGYRSFTRLGHTSPALLRTFVESNGDVIQDCLARWRRASGKTPRRQDAKS